MPGPAPRPAGVARASVLTAAALALAGAAPPEIRIDLPEPPASEATADEVARGGELYRRLCAECHGENAVSGTAFSDLRYVPTAVHLSWDAIVRGGIYATAGMPGFADSLSGDDAEAVRAWVIARAAAAWRECAGIDRGEEPERYRDACTRALPAE